MVNLEVNFWPALQASSSPVDVQWMIPVGDATNLRCVELCLSLYSAFQNTPIFPFRDETEISNRMQIVFSNEVKSVTCR